MVKQYTEERVIVDGYTIEVLDNHQSGGEVLFVFHGNSSSALSGKNLYTTKLGKNNRVISCSLLGHGNSDIARDPKAEYSIGGLGSRINKIINHYQITTYYLIGQSISGHAIIEAYDSFKSCKGLIAVSSPPVNLNTLTQAFVQSSESALLFKDNLTKEEVEILADEFTVENTNLDIITNDIKRTDPLFRSSLGISIFSGNVGDELTCYKKISFPVLFIKGSDDSFLSDDYYDILTNNFKLPLNIVSIKSCGHAVLLDKSVQCANAIECFFKSVVK